MNSPTERAEMIEKILNTLLPGIYPIITKVEVERMSELFRMGNPDYTVSIYTTLPNTIKGGDNYWDRENWKTDEVFDYPWLNDVDIPQILKYVGITDNEFSRELEIYDVEGNHIASTK
jgi:hypothetical protein